MLKSRLTQRYRDQGPDHPSNQLGVPIVAILCETLLRCVRRVSGTKTEPKGTKLYDPTVCGCLEKVDGFDKGYRKGDLVSASVVVYTCTVVISS